MSALALSDEQRQKLDAFAARLLEMNRKLNLTGAKTAEAVQGHIADSLTLIPYVRGPLVDIGSGGGFPAIPLALATGARITLIEALVKKAKFLESITTELGIEATVIPERAEVAAHVPELREHFRTATARAVASAPTVAELTVPFLAVRGAAVLQRGVFEPSERNALSDAALMLGAQLEEEITLMGERRVVIVRKTGPTPGRFPRRPGIPQKRPLCVGR